MMHDLRLISSFTVLSIAQSSECSRNKISVKPLARSLVSPAAGLGAIAVRGPGVGTPAGAAADLSRVMRERFDRRARG